MNDKKPDIGRLDYAIASLNDDAESMHSLITRSTDELERATAEGKRASDLASETLNTLTPLTEEFKATIKTAKELMVETTSAVEKLTDDFEQTQTANKEAFESFTSKSLKASEKTRDDLQTDFLSHKTATAARLDSLETATTKRMDELETTLSQLNESATGLEQTLNEKMNAMQKKIAIPVYGVIAVAILQLITLVAFFLK